MKPLRDSVVAIVGLGLIGGSLALALRDKKICAKILAVERDAATRADAITRGVVDEASENLDLVARADIIILATPVRTILKQIPRVGELARSDALIMDVGSTKEKITRALDQLPAHLQTIGAHPMCGKHDAGFRAADANLFRDAIFALTPLARMSSETIALALDFGAALGARGLILDAARHDRIVAATSHLPFALAVTLMTIAGERARDEELLFALAASGFRDTSRLAASDTQMMLDILLTNREPVAEVMREYARAFAKFSDALENEDESALRGMLERAAEQRLGLF